MNANEKKRLFIGEYSKNDLGVFEALDKVKELLKEKAISVGGYFLAGIVTDHRKYYVNIAKYNIFVAGYLPYHTAEKFGTFQRRYSRLVVYPPNGILEKEFSPSQIEKIKEVLEKECEQEYRFCHAQIYRLVDGDYCFEKKLENYEWLQPKEVFGEIIKEKNFVPFSEIGTFSYKPKQSKGYYLEGFEYVVKSMVVGVPNNEMSFDKKVLCIDVLSGVPGIVPYNEEEFKKLK